MKRRKDHRPAVPPSPALPAKPGTTTSRSEWLITAGLAAVTFLTFLPVLRCEFINFDDDVYVTNRTELKDGLSGPGLHWAWTAIVSNNWHPLTLMTLLIDHDLYGPKGAWGFHLTSLLLHVANTVLVFRCLRALTGEVWPSAAVAGLFALHPLRVEAVAWVSDRTDLLSTFFGLLALRAYVWYVGKPTAGRLAAVTGLFLLSLLAKPIWLTFPFLLLLLDWWPLRRPAAGVSWRRLIVEKTPLMVLVIAAGVTAFLLHRNVGSLEFGTRYPLAVRAENAVVSYAAYLRQTVLPVDLAIVYPHPGASLSLGTVLGALALVAGISALTIATVRWRPEWFVGWFWFVGTLLPLIGLVQLREEPRADRYTYVAHIGLFLAVAWTAKDLLKRARWKPIIAVAGCGFVLVCILYTRLQLSYWKNSLTVWEAALRVTSDNSRAINNYAEELWQRRRFGDALKQYDAYVKLRPNEARGYRHRGNVLFELDQTAAAAEDYRIALKLDPNLSDVQLSLGVILLDSNQHAEAEKWLTAAKDSTQPDVRAMAWYNLGRLRVAQKQFADAEKCFAEALRDRPDEVRFHKGRAQALAGCGQSKEAVAVIDRLLTRGDVVCNPELVQDLKNCRSVVEEGRTNLPE